MVLNITGTNVDIGQTLRTRIDDTIDAAVSKYFDGGYSGHVTVTKSGRSFRTECTIHLDTGMMFEASGEEPDAHASFDKAGERLEKRLRRYKRRLKSHKRSADERHLIDEALQASAFVLKAPDESTEVEDDFTPVIVAETETEVKSLSVSEAVMKLDMTEAPVIVFRNRSHGGMNVVFRRADGHFGWIDPILTNTRNDDD